MTEQQARAEATRIIYNFEGYVDYLLGIDLEVSKECLRRAEDNLTRDIIKIQEEDEE